MLCTLPFLLLFFCSSCGCDLLKAFLLRILASNRDEYLGRATAPTSFHSFHKDGIEKEFVLSGVDLQAGGSWLGINKHGEIAML